MVSSISTMVTFVSQTRRPRKNFYYTSIMITRTTSALENHIKHYQENTSGPALARMSTNTLLPALNAFVTSLVTKSQPASCIPYQSLMNDSLTLQWTLLDRFLNRTDMIRSLLSQTGSPIMSALNLRTQRQQLQT